MRSIFLDLFLQLAAVATVTNADVVYITDLPNFTSLAPCAQSGVSYAVQSLTYSDCPPGTAALESCACSKGNNAAAVASTISSYVLYSCDSTATEDVSSASVVFDNYCNQDASMTPFAAPEHPVSDYITALPAFSDLASCAGDALSYAIGSVSYTKCPPDATALAPCACERNQNSLLVSQEINSNIQYYCGTTMTEDMSSAHAVFSGYCGLNNGTSQFPTLSELPGSLTYYISDMTEYSALAPCAQSAMSYEIMNSMASSYCPNGPGNLASCACAKGGNSAMISHDLASQVSGYCSDNPSEDYTSVQGVFDFYCSAANGLVKAAGITAAETTSAYGSSSPTEAGNANTPLTTGKYKTPTPTKTSGGGASTGTGSASSTDKSVGKKSSVPLGGVIAAAVGGVALIILIIFVGWRYRRKRLSKIPSNSGPGFTNPGNDMPPDHAGKAELASTNVAAVPGQGKGYYDPSQRKPSPMPSPVPSAVSPITREKPGEMYSPPVPQRAELQPNYVQPGQRPAEMQGFNFNLQNPQEVQGSPRNPRHEMDGMSANLNSGPVYEMPGHHGWS